MALSVITGRFVLYVNLRCTIIIIVRPTLVCLQMSLGEVRFYLFHLILCSYDYNMHVDG